MINVLAFVLFVVAAVLEFVHNGATPFFFGLCGLAALSVGVHPTVANWRPVHR
jgi:hypothetical protein